MRTTDFDYDLPPELIAQSPTPVRDACRLLVVNRENGMLEDRIFRDIVDYIEPGDLLVANETRVLPARLLGAKRQTGGTCEVLLLKEVFDGEPKTATTAVWEALVKPGKRLKPGNGSIIDFPGEDGMTALSAEVIDWGSQDIRGGRVIRLTTNRASLADALHEIGHTPLPPYIHGYKGDEELYQTVYSKRESSAAAPTAGLHFTPELIERIEAKGASWESVELEVGLDTFRIVDEDDPASHQMHTEIYTVPQRTADAVARTKAGGGRVIAVGTTSVRSLESAWSEKARSVVSCEREATSLYLLPGSEFHVVDALITNFHVPRSTLMMLVSAFSSRETIMQAYMHAIEQRYRFFSFGDAMFIH